MLAAKPDNIGFDCLGSYGRRRERTRPQTIMVVRVNKEARNIVFLHFSQVYSLLSMITERLREQIHCKPPCLINIAPQEKKLHCLFLVSIQEKYSQQHKVLCKLNLNQYTRDCHLVCDRIIILNLSNCFVTE